MNWLIEAMGAFTCDDDERSALMRPERAGESRCSSAGRRLEGGGRDIWRAEVGSRSYAVRVAAVPWNDGRLGGYSMFVSGTGVASWQVVESERVARPMGTQD
jgi:hypothetical protein